MSARRILLADADAFYVAVARLVDPDGAGKAPLLIVGGSADHRGVVTSASYEARRYGVQSAMPMARALRLCPGAMVVPVPMAVCVQKGREIRHVLQQFTPVVEQASSDEFYLDMTGTEKLYHHETLEQTAQRMRTAVKEATQLTVSIGGGTSRVVAKLAAGMAKPRSVEGPKGERTEDRRRKLRRPYRAARGRNCVHAPVPARRYPWNRAQIPAAARQPGFALGR